MASGEFHREGNLVAGNGFSLFPEAGMSETLVKECLNGENKNGLEYNPILLNGDGNGGEKVGEIEGDIREGDEDDEDVGDEDHEYLVGDFVWGKIRSHPWWPGQIYDPSDASAYATKVKRKDRLLVAYFGDGSFSWCTSSQLKPFVENYPEMSNQSTSKAFVNAVKKALHEISRLVELEMSCRCIPERSQLEVATPVNGGIRAGVFVPKGNVGRQLVDLYEPEKLLASIWCIARGVSVSNILEVTVKKSWLTAYFRAKGCCGLQVYHEPKGIEGLEDKNKGVPAITDFSEPVEVPIEEEWLSYHKSPEVSAEKLYRRKRKSVAELMSDIEGSVVKGSQSGKSVSEKRKRKINDETETPVSNKRVRNKKVEVSVVENGDADGEEAYENKISNVDKEKKSKRFSSDGGKERDEALTSFASRERKKSRFLSSPYRDSSSKTVTKRDFEAESEKISKMTKMGERISRAASQLIGSPSGDKINRSKPIVVNVDLKEVLVEIQSAAFDPLYVMDKSVLDIVTGFVHSFRDSMFLEGSNYEMYHKDQPGKVDEKKDEKNPVTLVLTFPPGFSLPARNDLINTFSKFGDIDESETDVFYNSYCARISFVNGSDAEEAFKASIDNSPFGDANVNFRLRYPPGAGGTNPKGPEPSVKKSVDDAPSLSLGFVREKLEMMTSMLENSGARISPKMKIKLQDEIKGLLEKVREMERSSF